MNPSDAVLLQRWARQQDAEALHLVVTRHSKMVYNTCLRVLGNSADAEDVAQECFMKLARGVTPRGESITGLLHTMATRLAISRIKSESRRRVRENRYADQQLDTVDIPWDDLQHLVDEALAELPEPLQRVLVAHFLEGATHDAIAGEENVSRSAISHRVAKGVEELRKRLAKRGVPVAVGALAGLLETAPAEAAPPTLTMALGKVAMAGATAQGVAAGAGAGALALKVFAGVAIVAVAAVPLGMRFYPAAALGEAAPQTAAANPVVPAYAVFDLAGQIFDENETPLSNAMVKIYEAKPREGLGVVCPSCYLDCAKRVMTASDGSFTIPSVDANLLFKLLVVAEGYEPLLIENVDPAQGPTIAKVIQLDPDRMEAGHVLRGRVMGPDGKPVAGAIVEPFAEHKGTSTQYGGLDDIDALAATNSNGEFLLTSGRPDVVLSVLVEAAGLAKRIFTALPAGEDVHELALTVGVTVTGRVMKDGAPLAGISMGIVQTDHGSGTFLGETEVASGADGRFVFSAIAPDTEFCVYGQIDSLGVEGAVSAMTVQTKSDGSTLDVGTLKAEQGLRLSGQVMLSDGAAVPEETRVMISREPAWDWTVALTDADGRFEASNLPKEQYTITCAVPDYHMSAENYSLDPLNKNSLMGVIDRDISGLDILMEPGTHKWQQSPPEASTRYNELKSERIRGAE